MHHLLWWCRGDLHGKQGEYRTGEKGCIGEGDGGRRSPRRGWAYSPRAVGACVPRGIGVIAMFVYERGVSPVYRMSSGRLCHLGLAQLRP